MSKGFSNLYDGTKGSRKYPSFDKNIKKTSDSYPLTKSGYFGTEGSSTSRRIIKTKTPYKDARDFFDKLVKGFDRKPLKKDKTEKNNQQTVVLPDGTRINKRIRTSTKGSPAIDIFITKNTSSGLKQQKIHFIKENN